MMNWPSNIIIDIQYEGKISFIIKSISLINDLKKYISCDSYTFNGIPLNSKLRDLRNYNFITI